jgi:hypothetical protein
MTKIQNKKASRVPSKRSQMSIARTLSDGPAYAGQQKVILRLPSTSGLFSTAATTGIIALTSPLGTAAIAGFTTRFASTFDEYRILGIAIKIRAVAQSTGITNFFLDEKNPSAPTSLDAQERIALRLPNSNANSASFKTMMWRARDLLDLEYSTITTATTPVFFKVYTDAPTFGSPIVATPLFIVEYDYTVEFRGLKSA